MQEPQLCCEKRTALNTVCKNPPVFIVLFWSPDAVKHLGMEMDFWGALAMCKYHTTAMQRDRKQSVKVLPLSAINYEHTRVEDDNGASTD